MIEDRLLTQDEAAAWLGDMPPETLRVWRHRHQGPAYVKVGRHVRYRIEDLRRWVETQRIEPQSVA